MIDERWTDLINRHVDGETSQDEGDLIMARLKEDPEFRRYYDDLVEIGRMFRATDPLDPPEGLRERILHGIRPRARSVGQAKPWSAPRLNGLFTPRLAYVFAAGVFVGAFILALITGVGRNPADTSLLHGTVGARRASVETMECLRLDLSSGTGVGCVSQAGSSVEAEIELDTSREETVLFLLGEGVHFDRYRVIEAGDHSISVSDGRTELTSRGSGKYVFVFENTARSALPLSIEVLDEHQLKRDIRPRRG